MGVGVLKWCAAAVFCCLILAQVASTVPAPPDYDALSDMYDLLSHGVERRGPPSMRLRFGKRGGSVRSWQQVSQRSEPSLRLRYGKRTVDEAEPLLDHELVRKDRTPALRLRFGKRTSDYLQDDAYDTEFLRQDRAPALRLRFGKRDVSYGQDEEATSATNSHEQ